MPGQKEETRQTWRWDWRVSRNHVAIALVLLLVAALFMVVSTLLPFHEGQTEFVGISFSLLLLGSIAFFVSALGVRIVFRRAATTPVMPAHRATPTLLSLLTLVLVLAMTPIVHSLGRGGRYGLAEALGLVVYTFALAVGIIAILRARQGAAPRDVPGWGLLLAPALALGLLLVSFDRLEATELMGSNQIFLFGPFVVGPLVGVLVGRAGRVSALGVVSMVVLSVVAAGLALPVVWFSAVFFGGGM